jgi:hypothetical protein
MTAPSVSDRPVVLDRDAWISPCKQFRYTLTRRWGHSRAAGLTCWLLLNPSTADGKKDDQTVRRIVDFSHQWGYDALVVVNLFGLRATRPAALALAADPIGPDNDAALLDACLTADLVVAAWGAQPLAVNRSRDVLALLDQRSTSGRPFPMSCLGLTTSGQPRHPSRRSRSASLEVFR